LFLEHRCWRLVARWAFVSELIPSKRRCRLRAASKSTGGSESHPCSSNRRKNSWCAKAQPKLPSRALRRASTSRTCIFWQSSPTGPVSRLPDRASSFQCWERDWETTHRTNFPLRTTSLEPHAEVAELFPAACLPAEAEESRGGLYERSLCNVRAFAETSKMSHAGSGRAARGLTIWILRFHFGMTLVSTRRDRSPRWLWRLVRLRFRNGEVADYATSMNQDDPSHGACARLEN